MSFSFGVNDNNWCPMRFLPFYRLEIALIEYVVDIAFDYFLFLKDINLNNSTFFRRRTGFLFTVWISTLASSWSRSLARTMRVSITDTIWQKQSTLLRRIGWRWAASASSTTPSWEDTASSVTTNWWDHFSSRQLKLIWWCYSYLRLYKSHVDVNVAFDFCHFIRNSIFVVIAKLQSRSKGRAVGATALRAKY